MLQLKIGQEADGDSDVQSQMYVDHRRDYVVK
jgi:hypothetical protein